jgi:hypothetical protein
MLQYWRCYDHNMPYFSCMLDWVSLAKHNRKQHHKCHNKGDFIPVWILVWFLRCIASLNSKLQTLLPYGFLPLRICQCWICCKYLIAVFTLVGSLTKADPFVCHHSENCTAQTKHLYGFSAVWTLEQFLTLNLLMSTIVAPPSNASKWQMGFNSAFKGLISMCSWQMPIHWCRIWMIYYLSGGFWDPISWYT